ncbi:MAG TPA: NupC/NupG family nucleoside CNT transporter, partial [Ligilactobacillus aviarius]|nr:NupC/NupG family nucleoside CNT transporter [Ligilactobacillus aviarius]
MYLAVNIIGLLIFLLIGWLFSKDRKKIDWKGIGIMVVFNLLMAFFLVKVPWGRDIVKGLAAGFD